MSTHYRTRLVGFKLEGAAWLIGPSPSRFTHGPLGSLLAGRYRGRCIRTWDWKIAECPV